MTRARAMPGAWRGTLLGTLAAVLLAAASPLATAVTGLTARAATPTEPAWRVDEITLLDDGPVTPTASVRNADGEVFAVYGKPGQVVKFRLEFPAPGLALDPDHPLTMQVDAKPVRGVTAEWAMRRDALRVDPRWVEWEFGQYVPRTNVALVLYDLRVGKTVHFGLSLVDGTTRELTFGLVGARERLGNVAPPFTAEYERENLAAEARGAIEMDVSRAQVAAEARCGARAGERGPPCAQRLRDCVLTYPEDVLSPERARRFIACFDAVRP